MIIQYMDVSKNRGGPPKWMVKIMENPIKMDDLGGFSHYFWKHPYMKNAVLEKVFPSRYGNLEYCMYCIISC